MGKSLLENVREGMVAQVPSRADGLENAVPSEAFAFRTKLPEGRWQSLVADVRARAVPPPVPEALIKMMAQAEADMQSIMYSTGVERLPPPGSLVPGEMRRGMDSENEAKLMRRVAVLEAAPVELYRADERKIDALTAQRDARTGIAVRYMERINALEAENLALKAQIAAFTAANVAKPADARKPMPANALAGRRDDPRRIGS